MSTFDLDTTGTQSRPIARRESNAPDASTMIGLQRLAGNSAVTAAIRSGQIASDGPINLQRLGEDDDEDFEEEEEGIAGDDGMLSDADLASDEGLAGDEAVAGEDSEEDETEDEESA